MKRKTEKKRAMINSAIECQSVSKVYKVDREKIYALKDVSLSIMKDTLTVISGANGSGKTTLLYIISELDKATSGKVIRSSKPGIVLQDSSLSILGDTPFDDVAFSLKTAQFSKAERAERISQLLEKVGLSDKMMRPSFSLSGGEKKRLAIASTLALERNIILLDEPYSALDYEGVKSVNAIIETLRKENITVVIVTHEIEKCLALSSHFIVLNKGEVVFDGTPEEGISEDLEKWGIKNPLLSYIRLRDLQWR